MTGFKVQLGLDYDYDITVTNLDTGKSKHVFGKYDECDDNAYPLPIVARVYLQVTKEQKEDLIDISLNSGLIYVISNPTKKALELFTRFIEED